MSEVTAIIPVKIDSEDRFKNLHTTIDFLLKHHTFNIIVKEVDDFPKCELKSTKRIKYIFEYNHNSNVFHRTKILNEMLLMVDTKYTINYDCDMLLPKNTFLKCIDLLESRFDLVYPYQRNTIFYTSKLNDIQRQKFINDDNTDHIDYLINKYMIQLKNYPGVEHFINTPLAGIVCTGGMQFFNTKSYIEGYGENETFVDWGPEDYERLYRFYILGYKIGWIDNGNIYHVDHQKTESSDCNSQTYKNNLKYFISMIENIKTKQQMVNHMNSLEYTKKILT